MIKKAMISQPMAGKTEEEIVETQERAIEDLEKKGYSVVNTLFEHTQALEDTLVMTGVTQTSLWFLAKSLEAMSKCHTVYFCKGWETARGCWVEYEAAAAYGLEIIYEED